MAVFLKPNRGTVFSRNLDLSLNSGVQLIQHVDDRYCMSVSLTSYESVLDKDGEPIKESLLKSGQRGSLNLGTITTKQYHVMLVPNPELARHAYIGGPLMVEPMSSESLDYLIKAERQIDLSSLEYLMRIYLLD